MSKGESVIPDEALDAAVDALVASRLGDHPGINGEEFVEAARKVLEAAAPHMLAEAWDDAFDKGSERGAWEAAPVTTEPHFTNPYRSQA